jgi:hypothetical protein
LVQLTLRNIICSENYLKCSVARTNLVIWHSKNENIFFSPVKEIRLSSVNQLSRKEIERKHIKDFSYHLKSQLISWPRITKRKRRLKKIRLHLTYQYTSKKIGNGVFLSLLQYGQSVSLFLFIGLYVCHYVCLFVHLSFCPFVCLSVCPFVCLSSDILNDKGSDVW